MDHPYNTGYQVKALAAFYDSMSGSNQTSAQTYIQDYYEHWKSLFNPLILWPHMSLMTHPVGRTDFWALMQSPYFASTYAYAHGNATLFEDAAYHYSTTLMNFRYELHGLNYLKQVEGSKATEIVDAVQQRYGIEPPTSPWMVDHCWTIEPLSPKALTTFIAVALRRMPEILTMREQANGEELLNFMQELYNKATIIYPDTAFVERGFHDLMILYAFAGIDLPSFDVNLIKDPFKFIHSYSIYKIIRENQVGVDENRPSIPQLFQLFQNYPNPFNSETTISYQLPVQASVTLEIYNLLGQEIWTVVNEKQSAGHHSVVWDGKNKLGESVGSGIYFYQLKTDNPDLSGQTKKILFLK